MPAGGLLQLVSCSDNKLLVDNLNFSHFKLVYKTSHPFSFQDLNIKFKGQNKFDSKHHLKIPNYGDLLQNLTMYCELPSLEARYNNDIPTELRLNIDNNIFNLSTNNINYILERLNDFTYFTYFENDNIINVYNWLDRSKELKKSTIYQKVKDYNIADKKFVSPVNYDPNNVLINELNQLCFNYVDKKNDVYNFYYPLQMQYLLHLLQVNDDRKIMTSYDYYQQFISKLTNYIVETQEIQLIKYIEEKQQDYSLTSLDNQIYYENIIINLILNIYTTSNIEPLMYFYKKNGVMYELSDILVNKKYSITNSNYIIKTEKYTNNDITIENEVVSNAINNKIYFIGSRPQIIKSEDLFQILKIKFIKSRTNNISIYTSNPDEAIEWEIKIINEDTTSINLPPLNDENKYLMYIYNSITPNEQDITDYQGKYIIDNSQKKYFVDKNDNYIPITFYIEDLSQLNINKSFIPVLLYSNLQSNIDLRYNKKYFLDKDMNFVLIKEMYIDDNGNTGVIVSLKKQVDASNNNVDASNNNVYIYEDYYVDASGNYRGPIYSYEDISDNYIVDATADFIIDLIGNFAQDSSIQSSTDISNNLIPVYDFINKGKGFKYVYKGKYYNYLNLYYKNNYSKPSNLVDGFPYLLPFAILELSTYYNNLIILKKLNLPGISETDLYYHTSEIVIRNNNTDKFAIYGNKFVNINDVDVSNNVINIVEDYTIQNQEVYLKNNFKYYWNNNNLIDLTDSIDYITHEYWQESNIASRFIIEANNINNYKFLPISNIKYENINYDIYENYKYIITKIKNLNLENYEIYNIIVNNIGQTIDINHNIIKNIFTNLFSSNYFFSQYVVTNMNVIALQSKLVAEHANKYLESIIGTYDNNLFVEKILNNWNEFIESQDLLFFKTIQSANSSSFNIIKMLKNYETFPTLKIKIKQISNEILLKKNINLILTNENDLSYNPIKISNLNYFDNNTNIKNFTNNPDYNNININDIYDINILKSLNIFTDNELNNLTFSFNKWTILEYDIIDEYYEMYIAPPDYIEFKKMLALLYFIKTKDKLSFYVFFNIAGSENIQSFVNDKIRRIYNWECFDDNYIVKNRSVNDAKNRNVFLNTIIIDFYKYLTNKITSKIKNKQFLLYATIYFYNNLWHLIQDILHTIQKGYSSMPTLASAGNILIVNNFSNFYDQTIVIHIITNLFNNYFDYNIKSKCINYLDGRTFNMNNKTIRFYSVLNIENANYLYTDIELTNLKSIEVLQWFVFYLSNKLELYYLPNRKPRASDINFWATFDNYKEQIFNGATLTHINFFLKYCQKEEKEEFANDEEEEEFKSEQVELANIYYSINEVMMNIYDILNEEMINDKVNNTSYKIVTDNNKLFFGNIININNYSIFDILTEYLIQLFKQHYNNYTYNYLIEYFNVTKNNFIHFYRNIFDNVNTTGLTTYNLLRDIKIMTDFNWNNYDLIFPRLNPSYNNLIDYNLQVSTTYSDAKFYFKYDLFFRNKIINFINDIYIHNQTLILDKYNKYKKLFKLNKIDEIEIINNYNLTFGTACLTTHKTGSRVGLSEGYCTVSDNLQSTKEFKKAIEWEIFNEFGVDNNRLKLVNNVLGLYDNSNNKILDYTSIGIVNGNNILQYIIDGGMYKDTSNNLQPYFIHNYCVYSINLSAVNTPTYSYTINNGVYDSSNNLIFVTYNNLYYRVISKLYEIINNKLYDTNLTIVEKILYDKNTKIVHYLLNDLIPYNIKSAYDVSDNLTVTNIINDVFENTITLNDIIFDINRQLQNPDYMTPILLNILLRNSILPCDQSWESLVLISFWNNILNKFGLNDLVSESINNYNATNPCKQIKIINNTFYMDACHTFSTFEDRDIIKNIHFSTEKEIISKQELYSKLTVNELNIIKELNDAKLEIQKQIFNNIFNNKICENCFTINTKKYWYYLGELITDDEKQVLDELDWSIDQTVNTTLKILNGILVRTTNLPFGFNYDFNNKLVKFDHKINNILAMSYYKWNRYNFSPVEKKYIINNILEPISITQDTDEKRYIYITVNNHNLTINDYIVVYKLNEIYGPMRILDISNNILKIELNNGFLYENNYKYKIGVVNNYNYISWKNYYKQNYTPIKMSTDILIILKTFFDNVITNNLPDIIDVSSNFINVIGNLTNLSNVINNFPTDISKNLISIKNNLISITKNLSFETILYDNMSNLMNIRDNIVKITSYTNYYSTILRNSKSMNITKINNVSNTVYNYADTYNILFSNCEFFGEFLTKTNILKSLFFPLRKFYNEQNNGEIVNTLNNLETIFNTVILPNDLSENTTLFVDKTKNIYSQYLKDISDAYIKLGSYGVKITEWRNMNREFDNYNNNIGNLYLINDISNNIFNFFNLNDIVQTNIQNITNFADTLETYNIDNVIDLLENTNYLKNIINSLDSLNSISDIINIFLQLGSPIDIIYRDISENINNIIDASLNTITNDNIIDKLTYIIKNISDIKDNINESIVILKELSLITDITSKTKQLESDILQIKKFMDLFPIITTLARSIPDFEDILNDKNNNIPFSELSKLSIETYDIINLFKKLYSGLESINNDLILKTNSPIITKLNFITMQINKINEFNELNNLKNTVNILIDLMSTNAMTDNSLDIILYNNMSLEKNIENFSKLLQNYFCNNIKDYTDRLPTIYKLITNLPNINLNTIDINTINNHISYIQAIKDNILNIGTIHFTYEKYTVAPINFMYIIDNINNFIKLIDNIDDLIKLNTILNGNTISNTTTIYNNLNNIYDLLYINLSLNALEYLIDNYLDFKYKIVQWYKEDNNSIFLVCRDDNNYLDYYDWVFLNDSNPLFIIDKYDLKYNNINYKIIKLVWNNNEFIYDDTKTYLLHNGIGYILEKLNMYNILDTDVILDIYFTKINYNEIIKKYNNNLDKSYSVKDFKNYMLNDIISSIIDNHPLINLPNNKISKIYNQHFNNFRFTNDNNDGNNIITQYKINLQNKINNVIKLNSIINRPVKPRVSWIKFVGHFIFNKINLRINDYTLQEISSDWLHIWSHCTINESKYDGYCKMIGNTKELYNFDSNKKKKSNLYIPLPFYFQNKFHLALPLIALQNSELIFEVNTRNINDLIYIEDGASLVSDMKIKFELMGSFVYLSDYERELFAKMRHEYLIEQVQYCYENISQNNYGNIKLNFLNPVKDIFFIIQNNNSLKNKQYYQYENVFKNISLNFNGHDRFNNVPSELTSLVYPHTYYETTFLEGLNVYPFCLYPLSYQPSGSCSFTYLNNKLFKYNLDKQINNGIIKIFARSYNILRISSGIGCIFI
jgi:hypothetical protein